MLIMSNATAKAVLRLEQKYKDEVRNAMRERFKYGNVMEIPRLEKVVLNMGVGDAVGNPKVLVSAVQEMEAIAARQQEERTHDARTRTD